MNNNDNNNNNNNNKKDSNKTILHPKKILTNEEKEQAKLQWAAKYTSLHTLRQTFGRNRNKLWGDFDSKTTRKLYHTLLPRALLGLYDIGLWSPKELAPLAYEARLAAKKYARERCVVPSRVMAMFYDGFRMWRDWGTWSVEGMSWEQVWDKYETQILEEMMEDCRDDKSRSINLSCGEDDDGSDIDEYCIIDLNESSVQEEITAQICLRILERSCATNGMVDKLFLEDEDENETNIIGIERSKDDSGTDFSDNKRKRKLHRVFDSSKPNVNRNSHRRKRRRRRNAERDLAKIRIRLEKDIQDLLQSNYQFHEKKSNYGIGHKNDVQ